MRLPAVDVLPRGVGLAGQHEPTDRSASIHHRTEGVERGPANPIGDIGAPGRTPQHPPGRPATAGRSETFRLGSDPADSLLGAEIFGLGGVTHVFLTADFVSVTTDDATSWDPLLPLVIQATEGHFGE